MLKNKYARWVMGTATALFALSLLSCKQNTPSDPNSSMNPNSGIKANSGYEATYLVADISGFGAAQLDPNLQNGWGIAISKSGYFWISANHTGKSVIYDKGGEQVRPAVDILSRTAATGGAPTGVVVNATNDFMLSGKASKFIFAGEDGIIAAWTGGNAAGLAATSSSSTAVYKGLAMASSSGKNYLYATNFHDGTIDVYDKNFAPVSGMPFSDPSIPAGFAPFGIANIGGKLYVTYALHKAPDNMDDQSGPGNGYVDIYNPDGTLVMRFASQGTLNSPWGIAASRPGFGKFMNSILVGNFGDGAISAFSTDGTFLGQLSDKAGNTLKIDGLWGLTFTDPGDAPATDPNHLYFTAGPNGENDGAFGYISHE